MKSHKKSVPQRGSKFAQLRSRGFALVVTLSLMILLTVIAVGLLSLSAVSLRSTSQSTARAEAHANARMALMLAIGVLQKTTGADTRITAPSSIVDPNNPPLTGVWRSWEGTDHESNGRPIAPEYSAKVQAESAGGRFIDWLVSSAATNSTSSLADALGLVKTSAASNTVPLLAGGSLQATDTRQVHVVPTAMKEGGRFAWWVSGENQKALLAQPYKSRTADAADLTERGQSHSVANPEVFGLPSLIADPESYDPDSAPAKPGSKAVSRQTMAVIESNNTTEPQKKFHDLSAYSIGLLTNTATGGWRKDLSLLTERWDQIYASYPGGKLPLFRYTPTAGATTLVPKPVKPAASVATTNTAAVTAATPAQSNLYPWSEHSLILGDTLPCTYHAASASWALLQNFATSYKNFSRSSGAVKSPVVWGKIANRDTSVINKVLEIYNHKHVQRIHPQIARFQLIVYATAVESPMGQNPKRYKIRLKYVPIFTLWNPYNVTLEHTISGTLAGSCGVGWRRSLPGAMAIVDKVTFPNPDTVPSTQYRLLTNGNVAYLDSLNISDPRDTNLPANLAKFNPAGNPWGLFQTCSFWLPEGTLTYKPGEAKIFSLGLQDTGYGNQSATFRMQEGTGSMVGLEFDAPLLSNLLVSRSFWFLFRSDRVTKPYFGRAAGHGSFLSYGDGARFAGTSILPTGIGNEYHNLTALAAEGQAIKYWPLDEVDEVGYTVGELASAPWTPIFSTSFGPRLTIGTGPGTKQNRPTKGVVQSNALAAMVLSDPASGAAKDHPANNTFDFAYHSLSIGSTITPNLSTSKGFIGTGYRSGDGLSRLVMAEIPLRPMASLVELQSWSPRGNNPYPPFQMNLIGNSDATPLIPMDSVVPPTLSPNTVSTNLMHDDAYCTNHLLFDDWFLSSIAPDPEASKDINTIYKEFLKGERGLTNRSYSPISADSKVTDVVATTRIGEVITSNDGWLKVASRLEVEGMFNVNSTSVEAWKALLGHARNLDKIAMHGADRIVETSTSGKHAVTRGAVATDVEAGTGAGFGGQFASASEYTGFRSLNDDQIKDLAEKVVEQVRQRGPFLSLSEFVNRQLSSNKDLALAGAIQSAIHDLTADPMATLRNPVNSLSDNAMLPSDPKLDGVSYEFKEAAEGGSAYGAPGWIRQADILRPIAPVLSVRDDTFTIRAYGDSTDQSGKVIARAWCEAVVKRTRDFSDQSDSADTINPPVNPMNATFGRRYEIVSFRWLNSNEV